MKKFVFITGASGAGKTTLTKKLENELDSNDWIVNYFDSIGVPSVDVMVNEFGSCEKWQEWATHSWIEKLATLSENKNVILEGQFNPKFAIDALEKLNILNYVFICVHSNRAIREKRLIENRNQPELVNEDMDNWAEFLKKKTLEIGGEIIDTSDSDLYKSVNEVKNIIQNC